MIKALNDFYFEEIYHIINNSAQAYKGVIPDDLWHVPYMGRKELQTQLDQGVRFYGYFESASLLGVMGYQDKGDISLIRHAYVLSSQRGKGIGSALLGFILGHILKPVLIGTWEAAFWAIGFYEKHGFKLLAKDDKNRLLEKYWIISPRQRDTSVVLADEKWFRYKGT